MKTLIETIRRKFQKRRLLYPVIVSTSRERIFAAKLASALPDSLYSPMREIPLTGRDVVLVHSGETGWEEALAEACRDSPGRLFVIARECPRQMSLKLEWIADVALIGRETHLYEDHELELTA